MGQPDIMKVQPDMGTIFANLNSAGIEGAIKSYCLGRIHGTDITPELAKAAFMDAKKLVDAGEVAGKDEISIGAGKTVSLDILKALLNDISVYAKVASVRYNMLKLANKFDSIIK